MNISDKTMVPFFGGTQFVLDDSGAAVTITDDGALTIYVPQQQPGAPFPEHAAAATAMAAYFTEHQGQIMEWWEQVRKAAN